MPLYDYECTNAPACTHTWEEEARITADATKVCPACKNETAKRLIGRTLTEFRGPGWFNSGGY